MPVIDQPYSFSQSPSRVSESAPFVRPNAGVSVSQNIQLAFTPSPKSPDSMTRLSGSAPASTTRPSFGERSPVGSVATSPFPNMSTPQLPSVRLSERLSQPSMSRAPSLVSGFNAPSSVSGSQRASLASPLRPSNVQLTQSQNMPLRPSLRLSESRQMPLRPSSVSLGESRESPKTGRVSDMSPLRPAPAIGSSGVASYENDSGHPMAIAMSHMAGNIDSRNSASPTAPRGIDGQLRRRGG
jgi:hypothetical protein